jgi:hypothetical protein
MFVHEYVRLDLLGPKDQHTLSRLLLGEAVNGQSICHPQFISRLARPPVVWSRKGIHLLKPQVKGCASLEENIWIVLVTSLKISTKRGGVQDPHCSN